MHQWVLIQCEIKNNVEKYPVCLWYCQVAMKQISQKQMLVHTSTNQCLCRSKDFVEHTKQSPHFFLLLTGFISLFYFFHVCASISLHSFYFVVFFMWRGGGQKETMVLCVLRLFVDEMSIKAMLILKRSSKIMRNGSHQTCSLSLDMCAYVCQAVVIFSKKYIDIE